MRRNKHLFMVLDTRHPHVATKVVYTTQITDEQLAYSDTLYIKDYNYIQDLIQAAIEEVAQRAIRLGNTNLHIVIQHRDSLEQVVNIVDSLNLPKGLAHVYTYTTYNLMQQLAKEGNL